MTKDELQKLRDLPIEGVAERLGLGVSHHKCLCPFHADKHPSLYFKVSHNSYRCFVCGASGGTIDLVMHCLKADFMRACRWLANEHNLIMTEYKPTPQVAEPEAPFDASRYERFFWHPWLNEAARKFLFEERQLDARVVSWCRLTSWTDKHGVNWLQIPYYDPNGQLIGVQNRYLSSTQSNTEKPARFRFPKGSKCGIYNLPVLNMLKPGETCLITEGCSDCWSGLSAGMKAIAIPSATTLKKADMEVLAHMSQHLQIRFVAAPDADKPGELLFAQLKAALPNLVRLELAPGCKDYSEHYLLMKQHNLYETQ